MIRPALTSLSLFGLLCACDRSASKDHAAPSTSAAPTASATTAAATASTPTTKASPAEPTTKAALPAPSASASAKTAGGTCSVLDWAKDGISAKATSFRGKIGNGEGTNGRGDTEKFQTLVLDKPACGPDKASVDELQLYTSDKAIDLKKIVGKTVTIEGEPFASHTAHHHRPIVVEVKKLTPQ